MTRNKLGKISILCMIKALYVKFLIFSNRNVANRTRGFTKIVNKTVLKVMQQASDAPGAVRSKNCLFSYSSLIARHSASSFLRFVNIARLLKIDKYAYVLNDYH